MRDYNTSSQAHNSGGQSRRDNSRGGRQNDNRVRNSNNNNNNNNINNNNQKNFERRRDSERNEQQQNQYQSRDGYQSQCERDRSSNRERSGQRGGQHPDSSMGRDSSQNLGSVKFTPGYPTRELPPIETKADASKKFTGRCRLFVGNLPHNTTEEQVKALFEPFGEIGEIYLGPKSSFAFVKMDTKQNAEAARDALDCSNFDGRSLRVRLAAHAAAIRVKHLSPVVTNELLAYSFRYFGEIERAVVVVDDKGKSTGEGIVEYSRKQSAQFAIKRCQQECFMLTQAPRPVLVEPYDQHDEDEGLPEKSVNKNSIEYKEQRDVGPRFAEQGTFEHSFALRWKELYQIEKQKRDHLEQEILDARKNLQDTIDYARIEHEQMKLQSQLQQLKDNQMRLQQMKEQTLTDAQQRDEQRKQEEAMLRKREQEILSRQQLGNQNFLSQQDTTLRSQAHAFQDMISPDVSGADQGDQKYQPNTTYVGQESDQSGLSVNPMLGSQGLGMPGPVRSFSDAAMIYMQQTPMAAPTIPVSQAVFTGYIPPPPLQGSMDEASSGSGAISGYQQQNYSTPSSNQQNTSGGASIARQQKFNNNNRQFNNTHGSNINPTGNNGRARKRGRF